MSEPTPYVNADYTQIYYRVTDVPLPEARKWAANFRDQFSDPWIRTRFLGKQDMELHDCPDWDGWSEDPCGRGCHREPSWVFELYDPTAKAA